MSLKMEYESVPVVNGINIKSSSLELLVAEIVNYFDPIDGSFLEKDEATISIFLQMHKWFTTSINLLSMLTDVRKFCESRRNVHDEKSPLNRQHSGRRSYCVCSNPYLREKNNLAFTNLLLEGYQSVQHELAAKSNVLGNQLNTINDVLAKSLDRALIGMSQDTAEQIKATQRSSCYLIRYWLQTFPVHFDTDKQLYEDLSKFKNSLLESDQELYNLLDTCSIPSYDWMRRITIKNPKHTERGNSQTKVSLVFLNLTPEELARHLTYIDYKACRRISFTDYESYARSGTLSGITRLERSVLLFNGLTQWVQLMILSKTTAKQRATVITKLVKVSQHLLKLNNFNSLMAVVGAITHSSISRLHKTFSYIPADMQKVLSEFANLISSKNNFQAYRKELSSAMSERSSSCCIPIVLLDSVVIFLFCRGVHLKDLVALHNALPDYVHEPPLINFRKMAQLSAVMSSLTKLQDESLPFEVSTDLIDTLKLALDVFYSEEEIFELSLAREPRANGANATSPSILTDMHTPFPEWVSGIKPPDKETINKHVTNMVTAMFKNYDLDKDGYISVAEFENIASNFPFMEAFCVLEANEYGLLGEAEIRNYFLSAKCNVLKNSYTHNFSETTYFKPTYCEHCSGLLWGLIKQGWKCKDCGISAHKSCKDIIVVECKPRPCNKSALLPSSPSISSLTPPTPSTPELGYPEPRFTFNQKSLRKIEKKLSVKQRKQSTGTQTDVDLQFATKQKSKDLLSLDFLVSDRDFLIQEPDSHSKQKQKRHQKAVRRHTVSLPSRAERPRILLSEHR